MIGRDKKPVSDFLSRIGQEEMTAVFSEGVSSMSNGINPCTKKPEEDRKRSYVKSI